MMMMMMRKLFDLHSSSSAVSLRRCCIVSLLLAVSSSVSAFVPVQSVPKKPSSTTLFYRDDIPPIGSSPTWETPNDFQQFLTQCSMQSFMFLCHSLRDDQTVRWLHEFTEPVLQESSNINATEAGIKPQKQAPKKVSLQEAANAALADMQLELEGSASASLKDMEAPPATTSTESTMDKKTKKKSSAKAKDRSLKKKLKATKKELQNAKTIQSGFASFSKQATTLSLSLQETKTEETKAENEGTSPKSSWAPTQWNNQKGSSSSAAKTDISALYGGSSIPTKKPESNSESSESTPSSKTEESNKEPSTSSDMSALYGAFSIPTKKSESNSKAPSSSSTKKENKQPAKSFSPFGNMPATSSNPSEKFATTSSTSSLYAAPDAKAKQGGNNGSRGSTNDDSSSFTNYKTLPGLKYHGLAMFNRTKFPTWESYFERLLEQPTERYVVESNHKHVPSYEFDIDPASLCSRMLSVRAQIAQEFEHDLTVIAQMGGHTLKSYWKMLQDQRAAREKKKRQQKEQQDQGPQSLEQSISKNGGAKNKEDESFKDTPYVHRANLLFLDSSLPDDDDCPPSPLRKGNFDLLTLLTTQEAIHRVLNDPQRQARKSAEHGSNQFLQDFYVSRLLSHFSGDQPYGRADDFMEELLECSPRMVTVGSSDAKNTEEGEEQDHDGIGGISSLDDVEEEEEQEDGLTKDLTYLIDPVGIAETILNERETVALEWKQQLQEQAKVDHMTIQKMVLAKLMGSEAEEYSKVVDLDGSDSGDTDESCFE